MSKTAEEKAKEAWIMRHCLSKRSYSAQSSAMAVIGLKGKKAIKKLESYKCRVCDGWHIGHIVPRKVRLAQ